MAAEGRIVPSKVVGLEGSDNLRTLKEHKPATKTKTKSHRLSLCIWVPFKKGEFFS